MSIRHLVILLLLLPASVSGQQKAALSSLQEALNAELEGALFSRCLSAVEISDARSGAILYARNAGLLLRPASNAKLVTSAAAVPGLPADFHFETLPLRADSAGRSIACVGGGDPLFGEQDIQKLAEFAAVTGVAADTLIMDASLYADDFYGAGWMWDDEADPFTPYLGAFSIGGNTFTVSVRKSGKTLEPKDVSVSPSSALFPVELAPGNTGSGFGIRRGIRENRVIIEGQPPSSRTVRKRFSIWKPQQVFADLLLQALRERGSAHDSAVIVFRSVRGEGYVRLGIIRRPLPEVLDAVNKQSDNLSAEAILRALSSGSGQRREQVSAEDGLKAMRAILARNGVPDEDIALVDGSGISFYNLLTASGLGRLLRLMAASPSFDTYARSLAVGGTDGTLRSRMRDLPAGTVRAKTGTVRGVSALSGYVQASGGRLLAFVILMQNFSGKAAPYRAVQDRIVRHCLDYSSAAVRQPR